MPAPLVDELKLTVSLLDICFHQLVCNEAHSAGSCPLPVVESPAPIAALLQLWEAGMPIQLPVPEQQDQVAKGGRGTCCEDSAKKCSLHFHFHDCPW